MDNEREAEILYPEPEIVKVEDREYKIYPLKLRQMRLLVKLAKIDLKSIDDSTIDSLTNGVSEILGEKDIAFLESNLDLRLIKDIFQKVRKVTYAGVPTDGGTPKGKADGKEILPGSTTSS